MRYALNRRQLVTAGACAAVVDVLAQVREGASPLYPSKPVRVIMPFPAGGGADVLARMIFGAVSSELGQSFIVENISGAGGNVGSAQGSKAEADGYTILYSTNGTLGINRTLYKRPGFDALNDLVPVCRMSEIPFVTMVRSQSPFRSLRELLQHIKDNPGKLTFASSGNGTTSHLAVEIIKAQFGLHVVHIPYRGGAAAVTDLIGGQVDFMTEVAPNAVSHIRSGRLRALAVTTQKRASALSETPTYAEAGFPGISVRAWDGLTMPAKTPAAIVNLIASTVGKVMASPEITRQLVDRGVVPSFVSGDAFRSFVRQEIDRWGEAVRRSGAVID